MAVAVRRVAFIGLMLALMLAGSLLFAGASGPAEQAQGAPPGAPGDPAPAGNIPAGAGDRAVRYEIALGEAKALYRVGETLIGNNRFGYAVGMTDDVRGTLYLDPADLRTLRVETVYVNIYKLRSNNPQRDEAIRTRWLESQRFPVAEFVPQSIQGLPETYEAGSEIPVDVVGLLKVRDVEQPVRFAGVLTVTEGELKGLFQARVLMTSFGFNPPSVLGVLRAENEVDLFLDLTARPATQDAGGPAR